MISQREVALTFIEELRRRKTVIKEHIAKLENDLIDIDIQIREIRQHIPLEEIKPIVSKRLTQEQKDQKRLEALEIELTELKKRYNIE